MVFGKCYLVRYAQAETACRAYRIFQHEMSNMQHGTWKTSLHVASVPLALNIHQSASRKFDAPSTGTVTVYISFTHASRLIIF